ncbi:transposase, partial [Pseudofrankia sp. BMG5.36]|uniref:transposase n=1 Tax=Pseudofrankia sp. BMG5.36 TaxID=1834512 RepID=UPI001F528C63
MGSTRRKFTQEYKDEAVALVLGSDRTIAEVAKSLGINECPFTGVTVLMLFQAVAGTGSQGLPVRAVRMA